MPDITDEIQITEDGEENEVEVEVVDEPVDSESTEETVPSEELQGTLEDATSDELENYSEGVQKRIGKLTAKMREAERREKAALEYAKAAQIQLQQSSNNYKNLDESFVNEFENRVNLQETVAKSQLREALDAGDVEAQVEAQKSLTKAAHDAERLSAVRLQAEKNQAAPAPPAVPTAPAAPTPQPDPMAQDWADKNKWFGEDEPMTLTAFSIHKKLIEEEGFDPKSSDYYTEIDRRIRQEFPQKFDSTSSRKGPAVASAGRRRQNGSRKNVKLSSSEVAIAKKLGVSLEDYARQVALLQS
jgi:hypothetical protein